LPRRARPANWSVKAVTSEPSATPVVTGAERLSTVHSTNVAVALLFEADERTGVSSGARIVRTSMRSSRLETAEPGFVVSNVLVKAIYNSS
jgi:hypothetical protein